MKIFARFKLERKWQYNFFRQKANGFLNLGPRVFGTRLRFSNSFLGQRAKL
jgi:hypothetical protein